VEKVVTFIFVVVGLIWLSLETYSSYLAVEPNLKEHYKVIDTKIRDKFKPDSTSTLDSTQYNIIKKDSIIYNIIEQDSITYNATSSVGNRDLPPYMYSKYTAIEFWCAFIMILICLSSCSNSISKDKIILWLISTISAIAWGIYAIYALTMLLL